MFQTHPSKKDFAKAIGASYWTARRLAEAGIVRTVLYTNDSRIHVDDANRIVADGITPEERQRYSEYVKAESAGKAGAA